MLRSLNVSVSTSKVCPVTLAQNQIDLLVKVWKLECLFILNVKTTAIIIITGDVDDDSLLRENNW